ncbi:hypothetical protein BV25DRAFT_1860733 [Artomyces pyxidatus]|uniref:Uncharacterized protein n=1 Tax=Artomyces pyxidatus TaxID=48021 RepID=A0ACB8STD5_9AGAM|nr:hypothetical protein BV25DRAFT_1860733 [Artomyces pyxidatus]
MSPSTLLTVRASTVARLHTALSLTAFISALLVGCALHYKKIVKNGVAGWPEEWFPSVSATIGDWYPERNLFQILIALTSGPRFAILLFTHLLNRASYPSSSSLSSVLLVTGVVRTLSCGGWVYITSNDDHDIHDVLMILYIVCNLPWMWGSAAMAQGRTRRRRILVASLFWLSLIPMMYFFVQHKVHRIPGAYTRYAFFEWSLIFFDILYDSTAEIQFQESDLSVTFGTPFAARNGERNTKDQEIKSVPVDEAPFVTSTGSSKHETSSGSSAPKSSAQATKADLATKISVSLESRPFFSFAADVYFAYQAWTLVTSLPVTLFYFSVWKLALAGPEFSVLATLTPFLLGVPTVLSFSQTRSGRAALVGVAGGIGLGMWWVESMWGRLAAVMLGVGCTVVKWAAEWQAEESVYHAVVFLLGLLVSSLSKHLNHSNNPAWSVVDSKSGGYQKFILLTGSLALLELMTRPSSSPFTADILEPSASARPTQKQTKFKHPAPSEPWLVPSLSLGALLYALHERLSDSSSLIAWSWTGYPLSGPHPHAHAPLTLLAQSLGVLLVLLVSPTLPSATTVSPLTSIPRAISHGRSPIAHPLVYAAGVVSTYLLYNFDNWPSYLGGLAHAVFLTSITPQVVQQAGAAARARGPGRVFGVAWLIWVVFLFTGTFTVAYAFVPGAMPFRERTDLILAAQLALLAPSFQWRTLAFQARLPSLPPLPSPARRYTLATLSLVVLATVVSPLARPLPPAPRPAPAHARARLFNAGIWTVHFGIDDAGRDSQRRMRDLVRDMELEVLGLLETDLHRPVFGNRDLTRVMAEDLGYYVDFGPGPNHHTWGCVLLSKFPILKSTHHLLPSPHGELAPAIEAVLDVYGMNITVIVAHNGQEETPLDRKLQAKELARIMSATYPQPVVYLGYVVTKPHDKRPAPYEIMVTDGQVHDIDEDDLDRWCEYIFYRGLYRTAYARVSRSTITDTELQIGQFVVPRYGFSVIGASKEDRYLRAWKEELPVEHWFPQEYYGDEKSGGVRGHFYHVFGTPLYYKTPSVALL